MNTSLAAIYAIERQYAAATGNSPIRFSDWHNEEPTVHLPRSVVESALRDLASRIMEYQFVDTSGDVKSAISRYLKRHCEIDVPPSEFSFLPNATAAVHLVLSLLRKLGVKRILVVTPVYFSVLEAARSLGLSIVYCHLTHEQHYAIDAEALLRLAREQFVDAIWITNPVFSTGCEIPRATASHIAQAVRDGGEFLVLDNALGGLSWSRPDEAGYSYFDKALLAVWNDSEQCLLIESPAKKLFLNGAKHAVVFARDEWAAEIERSADESIGSLTVSQGLLGQAIMADENVKAFQDAIASNVQMFRNNFDLCRNLISGSEYRLIASTAGFHTAILHAKHRMRDVDMPETVYRLVMRHGVLGLPLHHFGFYEDNPFGYRINLSKHPDRLRRGLLAVAQEDLQLA